MAGGAEAVVGATVKLWSTGTAAAQVGSSVVTDSAGHFSVNFTCPSAGTLMYVTAAGGSTTGSVGANAHRTLASALGACTSLPAVTVNELTSAAAAYAFSPFAPAAGSAVATFQGNVIGLTNAFTTTTSLVVASSGALSTSGLESNTAAVQQQLDTVANAMTACNNSNNVAATSAVCTELFSCAQAGATFVSTGNACTGGTGTPVTDTLSAAIAIVQNAGTVSTAGVFDVGNSSTPFVPALSAAPNDWSLPLIFTLRNFGPLAIDASGHIWVLSANQNSNASPLPLSVAELGSGGLVLSPSGGWSTGGIQTIDSTDTTNLAIDQSGNVWVGGSSPNIAEINQLGVGVSPSTGWNAGTGPDGTAGVTIDSSGNAWFASGNAASVFELSSGAVHPVGFNISGTNGYTSSVTVCDCNGIAADTSGDVYLIGSQGAQPGVAKMSAGGVQGARVLPPQYTHFSFRAIAADDAGSFWITDQSNHGVWQFVGSTGTFNTTLFANNAGSGTSPNGIAIDGAAHKWVANQTTTPGLSSVTEFSANAASNLSPDTGFGAGALSGARSIAVDQSGDVWVGDGGTKVIEFVGAGAPTRNPVASALAAGSFVP